MSQQKILLTVCLVAGFIGAAYAQGGLSVNPMQCGQKAQNLFNQYIQDSTNLVRSITEQASQTGASAMDISKITDSANELIASFGKLGDTSQLTVDRYTTLGAEIVTKEIQLATLFMRPDLGMSALNIYFSVLRDSLALNTKFVSSVTAACMSN